MMRLIMHFTSELETSSSLSRETLSDGLKGPAAWPGVDAIWDALRAEPCHVSARRRAVQQHHVGLFMMPSHMSKDARDLLHGLEGIHVAEFSQT